MRPELDPERAANVDFDSSVRLRSRSSIHTNCGGYKMPRAPERRRRRRRRTAAAASSSPAPAPLPVRPARMASSYYNPPPSSYAAPPPTPPWTSAYAYRHHAAYLPQHPPQDYGGYFDRAEPLAPPRDELRTRFVAGLPADVKPREVYNLFREFPGYVSSYIRSGKSAQSYAFAVAADQPSALGPMSAANGLTFDIEKNCSIHVDLAKSNSRSKRPRTDCDFPKSAGKKSRNPVVLPDSATQNLALVLPSARFLGNPRRFSDYSWEFPSSRELCDAKVVPMDRDCYKVQFDRPVLGVDIVNKCCPVKEAFDLAHSEARENSCSTFGEHCKRVDRNFLGADSDLLSQLLFFAASNDNDIDIFSQCWNLLLLYFRKGSPPFEEEFSITLVDPEKKDQKRAEREYKISIRIAGRTGLYHLHLFLCGRQRDMPQKTISFFSTTSGHEGNIGEGLECWRGYYQSLRPTQMELSVNIDITATSLFKPVTVIQEFLNLSATSFFKPVTVVQFVQQFVTLRDISRPVTDRDHFKNTAFMPVNWFDDLPHDLKKRNSWSNNAHGKVDIEHILKLTPKESWGHTMNCVSGSETSFSPHSTSDKHIKVRIEFLNYLFEFAVNKDSMISSVVSVALLSKGITASDCYFTCELDYFSGQEAVKDTCIQTGSIIHVHPRTRGGASGKIRGSKKSRRRSRSESPESPESSKISKMTDPLELSLYINLLKSKSQPLWFEKVIIPFLLWWSGSSFEIALAADARKTLKMIVDCLELDHDSGFCFNGTFSMKDFFYNPKLDRIEIVSTSVTRVAITPSGLWNDYKRVVEVIEVYFSYELAGTQLYPMLVEAFISEVAAIPSKPELCSNRISRAALTRPLCTLSAAERLNLYTAVIIHANANPEFKKYMQNVTYPWTQDFAPGKPVPSAMKEHFSHVLPGSVIKSYEDDLLSHTDYARCVISHTKLPGKVIDIALYLKWNRLLVRIQRSVIELLTNGKPAPETLPELPTDAANSAHLYVCIPRSKSIDLNDVIGAT